MVEWYRYIKIKKKVPLFCLMLLVIIILASCQQSEPKIEELTKEFLIGTWFQPKQYQNGDPSYLQFTEKGFFIEADSQSNLEVSPKYTGRYTFKDSSLHMKFDDSSLGCAGGFWNFQLEITPNQDLIFDTISYKCPEGRVRRVPSTYSRVSD